MVNRLKLRWGLVGCGWVARDYVIPAIEQAPNAELVAVSDRDPARVFDRPCLSFDELLATDIEALYIATPNDSHAALTRRAAAAGKHVLCEKPMATVLTDAECMVDACREAGVTYATAFDQRFHPAHLALRGMIGDGALGTITAARIHYACWLPPEWSADNWRIDPRRAGGGAFIDLAPHGLDLLQFLLGEQLSELQCLKQTRVFDYPVDDGAVAIGQLTGGCLATLQVAYNCPDAFPRRTLDIIGTEAMVTARNTMGQTAGGSMEMVTKGGVVQSLNFDERQSPFVAQIVAFSQCLLDQIPFPFPPERDLHTMKVLSTCL